MLFHEVSIVDRENGIERTLKVAPRAKAPLASSHHETTAQVLDKLSETVHLKAAEITGGHVLENDGTVGVQGVLS